MHSPVELDLVDFAEGKTLLEDALRIESGQTLLGVVATVVEPGEGDAGDAETADGTHDEDDGGDRFTHEANVTFARR